MASPHVILTYLAVVLTAAPIAASEPTAALEKLRSATGIESLGEAGHGLSIAGQSVFRGSEGPYQITLDARGRFVEAFKGRLSMVTGFDGEQAWEVDWNQTPRALDLGDREEALLSTWLWTGQWLLEPDALADISYSPDANAFLIELGELEAEIVIDPEDGLPTRASYEGNLTSWTAELGDYREFEGVMLPSRIVAVSDRADEISIHLETWARQEGSDYRFRDTPPTNWQFDEDANHSPTMRQSPSGHVLVRARINGERAGWFVFDSGAGGTAVSETVASNFQLLRIGRSSVGGAGGAVKAFIHVVPELRIGPAVMFDVGCVSLDLSFLSQAWGVEVAGVIGYDLLARTIVELTLDPAEIRIYDRRNYQLAGGEWQELLLPNRNAAVRASFEGHDGIFKLDTGAASSSVIFHVAAVETFDLLQDRETTSTTVAGIGGGLPALAGRVEWFELGGRRFENVEAKFATVEQGAFADRYTAGNVGGELWGHFTLVFDYAGRRIAYLAR